MVMTWGLFMKLGLPQMGCSPQITSPMGDLLTRIINQLLTGMILQGALDLIGKLKNTSSKIGRSWCKTFTVRPEYMIYIYMHIPTHLHSTCVNTHVYKKCIYDGGTFIYNVVLTFVSLREFAGYEILEPRCPARSGARCVDRSAATRRTTMA